MRNNNCKVCGLHKEACLHQTELADYKSDRSVSKVLWFSIGFLTCAFSVLIIMMIII